MSNNVTQTNAYDIDLSSIDNAEVDKLASRIESFYKNDSAQKSQLSYHWERNHLMLDGYQWLIYENSKDQGVGGLWSKLTPNPQNEYIPRPVTNVMFDAYQTLKGYLLKNKPRSTVRPNTQNQKDKTAAKIAEMCVEVNYEKLKEAYNLEHAASCLITYGTVFKKDYWDTSTIQIVKVPKMTQQPKIDPMTGQMIGMEEVQEVDPLTGDPLFDEHPLGDVNTAIIEPYRIALDPYAVNLHEARWIMEYSIRPMEWVKENYGKVGDGYTGRTEEIKEEKNLPNSMRRFFQLKTSSGVRGVNSNLTGFATTSGSEMIENSCVVKEYYERPTRKNPQGRLVVVASNIPLYVGPSPYKGNEMGDWHPYSECRWELVPGRFWGKSAFDDASEIQKQINSIDSIIILTRKTMAVPQKLIPHTAGIAVGTWTGQPGQEIYYRATEGAVPETIAPAGVDPQVWKEREQRVEDFKNITGAVDILKGDRPPGVTAASALNLLFEVGTGKLFPILDRWKMFIESSQKKQLKLIANKYKEPRDQYIAMLKMRNSDLTEESINKFIGQDLYDNCNVIIEAASAIPKLKSAEQAQLAELANMNVLGLENPANRYEFLTRFGIQGFDTDYSSDVKRAKWENDNLDELMINPENKPVVLMVDNHDIHKSIHSDRIKQPSFMDLPPEIQEAYFMHLQEHDEFMQQQQQEMMIQAAMTGQPPAPPAPNPMDAPIEPKQGSDMSKEMKQAMAADIKGPIGMIGA